MWFGAVLARGSRASPDARTCPSSPLTTDRSVDGVKRRWKFGRVRQMSSPRTLGGLPVLLEPARTRKHGTITHAHARSRPGAVAARTPEGLIARLVMLAGVIWRTRWARALAVDGIPTRHPAPATRPGGCPLGTATLAHTTVVDPSVWAFPGYFQRKGLVGTVAEACPYYADPYRVAQNLYPSPGPSLTPGRHGPPLHAKRWWWRWGRVELPVQDPSSETTTSVSDGLSSTARTGIGTLPGGPVTCP